MVYQSWATTPDVGHALSEWCIRAGLQHQTLAMRGPSSWFDIFFSEDNPLLSVYSPQLLIMNRLTSLVRKNTLMKKLCGDIRWITQQARDASPMFFWFWANVADGGPTSKQRWVIISNVLDNSFICCKYGLNIKQLSAVVYSFIAWCLKLVLLRLYI